MRIKTLRGSDGEGIDVPILDMDAIQLIEVSLNTDTTVSVDSGIYYIISKDSDFEFTFGNGDTSSNVRMPWFQNVYLELAINENVDLTINFPTDVSGFFYLIPVQEH